MRISFGRTLAVGLGLFAISATAATQCDLSWVGSSLSVAPTVNGHMVVIRGTDNLLRTNEWQNASKSWSGWEVLTTQSAAISQPWIQYAAKGIIDGAITFGQNIYTRTNRNEFDQWIENRNASGNLLSEKAGAGTPKTTANPEGTDSTSGRPTSFRSSARKGGQQLMISSFKDGTLRYSVWSPSDKSWDGIWSYIPGSSNIAGSPYALQLTDTTANIYARQIDGTIVQTYWNGSSFSGWGKPAPKSVLTNGVWVGAYSDPSSAVLNSHFLFSTNANGKPEYKYYTGSSWLAWKEISGFPVTQSINPVQISSGSDSALIYGIDSNGSIWRIGMKDGTLGRTFGTAERVNCLTSSPTP